MEQGSHDHLMKLNRDYAAMFKNFQQGDTAYIEVPVCLTVSLSDCLTVCVCHCQCVCLTACLSVCSRLPAGRQAVVRGSHWTVNQALRRRISRWSRTAVTGSSHLLQTQQHKTCSH